MEEGSEYCELVLAAVAALQKAPGVAALDDLVATLSTIVYKQIPAGNSAGAGAADVAIDELNTHPVQDLGLQSPPFAGLEHGLERNVFVDTGAVVNGRPGTGPIFPALPVAGQEEMLSVAERMKAGEFGRLYTRMDYSNTRDQPGKKKREKGKELGWKNEHCVHLCGASPAPRSLDPVERFNPGLSPFNADM